MSKGTIPTTTTFACPAVVQDVLAFLTIALGPWDGLAFRRICNKPARGIGPVTENVVVDHALRFDLAYYEALIQIAGVGRRRTTGHDNLDRLADCLSWLTLGYSHMNWATGEFLDVILHENGIGYEQFALQRSRSPDTVRATVAALRDLAEREPNVVLWDIKHDGKSFVFDKASIAGQSHKPNWYLRRAYRQYQPSPGRTPISTFM